MDAERRTGEVLESGAPEDELRVVAGAEEVVGAQMLVAPGRIVVGKTRALRDARPGDGSHRDTCGAGASLQV